MRQNIRQYEQGRYILWLRGKSMQATAKVTNGAISVRQELAVLGLTPEILYESIEFGESYRALCTPNDPPSFHGVTAWARSLRGLRESLSHLGWTKDDTGNYSTVVNPDKSLAISVATGDKETGIYDPGRPLASPKLKHPKGSMTQAAVALNRVVLYLFEDMAADAKAKADEQEAAANRITWILLKRRERDTVFAELSLASKLDGGQVSLWEHRIILEPFDVEPVVDIDDDSGDDSGDLEIDVPVRRLS
jgi:hypothetical protein